MAPPPKPTSGSQAPGARGNSETSRLLPLAKAGDTAALSALFARHFPSLRRWTHGRLPQWARTFADTTDIVQDALVRTFRRLDTFEVRRERALQAYLRTAVMNRIRDEIRRAHAFPAPEELPTDLQDSKPNPFDQAVTGQMLDSYRKALSALSDVDRQAIVARVELGYSYDQVALILGKATAEAARLTVIRALAKLNTQLERSE